MKKTTATIILILALVLPTFTATAAPVTLTSDSMKYDAESGRFLADGNVKVTAQELVLLAGRGEGYVEKKTFTLSGGLTLTGKWNGDKVSLVADSVVATLTDTPHYVIENGIKGSIGNVLVDADYVELKDEKLLARGIRQIKDTKAGVSFSAKDVKGRLRNGELAELEASGSILIKGTPGKVGDVAELRGNHALYSIDRGSVVLSGSVTAKQRSRTLRADSLVYFPETNRIEAIGKPRITINIGDEKDKKK